MMQDLKYAIRLLIRKPGFTLIAVLTLGLGIGANVAIFSVVNALVFKPLPYDEPERIVQLFQVNYENNNEVSELWSFSKFDFLRNTAESFENVAAYSSNTLTLTGLDEPELVNGEYVSASYFPLLRIQPINGRVFTATEDQTPGAHQVAVISHSLWQRRFGGDPEIGEKSLTLNGKSYVIIGVLPAEFRGQHGSSEVWLPLMISSPQMIKGSFYWMRLLARLDPQASPERAQEELQGLAARYAETNPPAASAPKGWGTEGIQLKSLKDARTDPSLKQAFLILLAAVGFVLLIACVNVANLLLTRAVARQKEIAIRAALGAGRGRLIRQFLTESLLLSLLGAGAGLLVASWSIDLLTQANIKGKSGLWLNYSQMIKTYAVSLDTQALLFAFAISLLTGLLCGLFPALQAARANTNEVLKTGGHFGQEGFGRLRLSPRTLLIVSEIALSCVLLIGAALMIKSFSRLQNVDLGFDPTGVTTFSISARNAENSMYEQLCERVAALPGVESAAVSTIAPLSGFYMRTGFKIKGRELTGTANQREVSVHNVTPEYFQTFRIKVTGGRAFTSADTAGSQPVAMINEAAAKRFFPGEDPVGQRIDLNKGDQAIEIIGLVGDIKYFDVADEGLPDVYIPVSQDTASPTTLSVRFNGDTATIATAVRRELAELNRSALVSRVMTMDEKKAQSTSQARYATLLLAFFALLALLLASVGLYGVMSFSVSTKTRDIGIRLALGAKPSDILLMVLKQGGSLIIAGLAVGLSASIALTRLMTSMLFGVSATDVLTYALIAVVLTLVALFACYLPARRATRVNPIVALRYE